MVFFTALRRNAIQQLKPLFDRVVVERAVADTKTKGGIMIPEKAVGKVLEGKVVAVGPGFRAESGNIVPNSLKVGDRVLLPEYGGSKIVLEEKEYHIFRETDIIGKFD
ncbi:10 kDa chaperonin [Aphelenchoides fujianensis]|nr:10 kDa chaperonin [Aphelenchoides fujianensis]KAI6241781.1 10 kDa chaperonin [Aphelenchoides fujianensis]